MENREARSIYESLLGKRISDVGWWRLKQALSRQGIGITKENLRLIAEIKKVIPHANLGATGLLEAYRNTQLLLTNLEVIQGELFLSLLKKQGITLHPSTVSRWFKNIGGFRQNRFYPAKKLQPLVIAAIVYKIKSTQKQVNRRIDND